MWSNGFYQTLELELPDPSGVVLRFSGSGIRRVIAHASGRWSLDLGQDACFEVELLHGWIGGGGRLVGLRWMSREGCRFVCGLCCLDPDRDRWRRLLVRLRVPMPPRLS